MKFRSIIGIFLLFFVTETVFSDTFLVLSEFLTSNQDINLDYLPIEEVETGCLDVLYDSGQIVFTAGINMIADANYPFFLNAGALAAASHGGADYLVYIRLNPLESDLFSSEIEYLFASVDEGEIIFSEKIRVSDFMISSGSFKEALALSGKGIGESITKTVDISPVW